MLTALGHWPEFLSSPSIVIMSRETAGEHFILSAMDVKPKDVCDKKPKSL